MNRHYKALELDKILLLLAGETSCKDAYESALELSPKKTLNEVQSLLQQTQDAFSLIGKFGTPSFGSVKNVTN